jgi:hypothetical protein
MPLPLSANSPEAAFRKFQDHLNRVLNLVLTKSRLEILHTDKRSFLSFLDSDKEFTIAVKLRKKLPWHLAIIQRIDAIKTKQGFILKTLAYAYRIQKAVSGEALVRFEYVSPEADPDFEYSRNHVQFHIRFDEVIANFSPTKLHIPTGWVTIESVMRFLFTELKVKPLRDDWEKILADSEEQFRKWTNRTVP